MAKSMNQANRATWRRRVPLRQCRRPLLLRSWPGQQLRLLRWRLQLRAPCIAKRVPARQTTTHAAVQAAAIWKRARW